MNLKVTKSHRNWLQLIGHISLPIKLGTYYPHPRAVSTVRCHGRYFGRLYPLAVNTARWTRPEDTGSVYRALLLCSNKHNVSRSCSVSEVLPVLANDVRYLLSPVRLSDSVCLSLYLSVTLVHPTQAVEIFGNISTAFCTLVILDIHWNFYGDRTRGTPPPGELNTRGVAKYSDFGLLDGYISETVQDRR